MGMRERKGAGTPFGLGTWRDSGGMYRSRRGGRQFEEGEMSFVVHMLHWRRLQ